MYVGGREGLREGRREWKGVSERMYVGRREGRSRRECLLRKRPILSGWDGIFLGRGETSCQESEEGRKEGWMSRHYE